MTFRYARQMPLEWVGISPYLDWDTSKVVISSGTAVDSVPDQSVHGDGLLGDSRLGFSLKPHRISASANFNGHDTISFVNTDPSVDLQGQRAYFQGSGLPTNGPMTFIIIAKVNTRVTVNQWLIQTENQHFGIYSPSAANSPWHSVCSNDFSEVVGVKSASLSSIIAVTLSAGTHRLYVNSATEEGHHASTGATLSVDGALGNLGAPGNASNFTLNGEVARAIAWPVLLTPTQLTNAMGILGTKYGITIT